MKALLKSFVLFSLSVSLSAHAFRTAIFPEEVKSRAAVWLDQDRVLNSESAAEAKRPVWIHAGDSLASAWADQHTLRERMARAETEELPRAGSLSDILAELPSPKFTWYAGSSFNYGLLGFLDHRGLGPWVVLSSALAGARLTPFTNEDALNVKVRVPERVKLVTLSLGGNDLCQDLDPASDVTTLKRIRAFKAGFSDKAVYVAWKVPDILGLSDAVLARVAQLAPSAGQARISQYCHDMWFENMCPALKTQSREVLNERRKKINQLLEQEFGPLFDPYAAVQGQDPLDLMGGDCFHPSRLAQKALSEALAKHIEVHYSLHP